MKPRVIMFEDHKATRETMSLLLEQRGLEVISAPDPTACPIFLNPEILCHHEDACGDFLLTDNRMPNMTGLEFIEIQSRRGCKGNIRNKAIMSGSWSAEELRKAEKLGCKTFSKPYQIAEIFAWLEKRIMTIPPDRKLASLDISY